MWRSKCPERQNGIQHDCHKTITQHGPKMCLIGGLVPLIWQHLSLTVAKLHILIQDSMPLIICCRLIKWPTPVSDLFIVAASNKESIVNAIGSADVIYSACILAFSNFFIVFTLGTHNITNLHIFDKNGAYRLDSIRMHQVCVIIIWQYCHKYQL